MILIAPGMSGTGVLHELERELRRRPRGWESWLVYADYLSTQGDPRGHLIALQHQLATAKLDDARARTLKDEIDKLREREQSRWGITDAPSEFAFEWAQGFVVGVTAPLHEDTIEPLAAVLAHPQARLLSRVCLRASTHDDEEEYDDDFDPEVEYEPKPVPDELLERLFALELGSLTSLALTYAALGMAGARSLATCERLGSLLELDLRYARLGDDAIAVLAASPLLVQLQSLKLLRNRIGPAGAQALAGVPFTCLRQLDLRMNPLGLAGAAALAAAPGLARLGSLYLHGSDVGHDGLRELSQSPHLPFRLRRYFSALASADHARPSGN